MNDSTLARLTGASERVHVASAQDKVYKDECMYSFATPESPGGLYTNLETLQSFSAPFLVLDHQQTRCALYLLTTSRRLPPAAGPSPTVLGIGVDKGFDPEAALGELETSKELVLLDKDDEQLRVPLPCDGLPERLGLALAALEAHVGAAVQEGVAAWQEERRPSKYASSLEQLPRTRTIPPDPSKWRCDETGVAENLWLNLSTGHIGSGRAHFDGSGGNGAAMRHFEATGKKHPLVVKLGTISPAGADVYSYAPDEDDMVLDPALAEHLAHWGIDMVRMEASEKSMAELQIEKNLAYENAAIAEVGKTLEARQGPGYVGLTNLGNSCYVSSVLQVLFSLPEVRARYLPSAARLLASAPRDPAEDLLAQLAKVGVALCAPGFADVAREMRRERGLPVEGEKDSAGDSAAVASQAPASTVGSSDSCGFEAMEVVLDPGKQAGLHHMDSAGGRWAVAPRRLRALVGRGHAEFASARQQDAEEYLAHLLELLQRAERSGAGRFAAEGEPTAELFRLETEDRVECTVTGRVSYKRSPGLSLGLGIPMDRAQGGPGSAADRESKRARRQAGEQGIMDILEAVEGEVELDAADSLVPDARAREGGMAAQTPATTLDAATESAEPKRAVPWLALGDCLEQFGAPAEVADCWSPAAQARTTAVKRSRISRFPRYLLLQLRRYYVAEDWTPKKLEVLVDMPQTLDLDHLRAQGVQPGEELQPEEDARAARGLGGGAPDAPASLPMPDEAIVAQLQGMGFSEHGCRRAARATGNQGVEAAMEWVLAHVGDPDFDQPEAEDGGAGAAVEADAGSVQTLTSMGFTPVQVRAALKACDGSVERAADWLFCHMDELDGIVDEADPAAGAQPKAEAPIDQAPAKYDLVAFISHMGANTGCGHYVCHIHKNGEWVIYNDEKVAVSVQPPTELGYLYVYRRRQ